MLVAAVTAGAAAQGVAATLNYSDITSRLYDLRSLARIPDASEHSGNFSSRDRAAQYNSQTGRYEKWYANDDGSGFIRREGDDIVAAEMTGPGVIWRIWSAQPAEGLIKIYIDGSPEPTLSMPFQDYFDNTREPFNYPQLVRDNARGKNSYIPIVYQKSCKIVLCKNWGAYYQITYSTFSADTKVPSFTGQFNDQEKACLQKADQIWAGQHPSNVENSDEPTEKTIVIAPGQQMELFNCSRPAAITALTIRMPEIRSASQTEMAETLRKLTLSMVWDGQKEPAVWSPLGDFFGTAPGINPYRSLPLGMSKEEFYCYWYMPFHSAQIILKNEDRISHTLTVKIAAEPLDASSADTLLRFHAKWHRDADAPWGRDRLMDDRWPDWMVLYTKNTSGRFCGMALHIWNPLHMWDRPLRNKYQWNAPAGPTFAEGTERGLFFRNEVLKRTYWWGEGDEKFFVDGESMPSTFGTGSEDYFGYAWGTPQRFDSAVQCQPFNQNNTGHISVCRWQIADNIPFQHSLEGCIEKYHDNNWPLLYAVTAYWYQQRDTMDIYKPLPVEHRINYYRMPELVETIPADGIFEFEGRGFDLDKTSRGHVWIQDMLPFKAARWNQDTQLLWEGSQQGDTLELGFAIPRPGRYKIQIVYTKAVDYGTFQAYIDGRKVGNALDLFHQGPVIRTDPEDYGTIDLAQGQHVLKFENTGKNPESQGNYFGFDYMKLQAVSK